MPCMTDYLGLGLASLGTSVIYFGLAIKIPKPQCRKLDKVGTSTAGLPNRSELATPG